MADTPFQQISVEELAMLLQSQREAPNALQTDGGETVQLIDVREPQEVATAAIPGFINLPLSQYEQWAPQIHDHFDAEKETLVMCHHGIRSAQMCYWLNQQGFRKVKNIIGGIDAYSLAIDSSIPRY